MNMSKVIGITFEEELEKNPELKESDIQHLKEWCSSQAQLPKISDCQLALFLYSNYYNLEQAKKTIEAYYTSRTQLTEFFSKRDLVDNEELRKTFKLVGATVLKKYTNEGYSVIVAKLLDKNSSKYVFNEHVKSFFMCMDLWMHEAGTTNGHIILIDTRGLSLGHLTRMSPSGIKKAIIYLQDAMPVRLKGIHYLVSSSVAETLLNMIKLMMKKELADMIYSHSCNESLTGYFPLEILPKEYGGTAESFDDLLQEEFKKLEDNRSWFQDEEASCRLDESKRVKKEKTGLRSFKNLFID